MAMVQRKTVRLILTILYKIMTRRQWTDVQTSGTFNGSDVDIKDGFIHLSAIHQVRSTAEKHFANQPDLVLVSVRTESLGTTLKWEVSRGGSLFPHIYGPLLLDSIDHVAALPLKDGSHLFPEGFPL
jgi:uncharacterized protein (DUF952 family)